VGGKVFPAARESRRTAQALSEADDEAQQKRMPETELNAPRKTTLQSLEGFGHCRQTAISGRRMGPTQSKMN
jgi:hypothetical protein